MRHRTKLFASALLMGTALPAVALAQDARVTADLNMRAGPSTQYPVVTTIPENNAVNIYGCTDGYEWCDVRWQGRRGWVFADYLDHRYDGRYVPVQRYGARIDLPILSFTFGNYWDDHYRTEPWYRDRARWRHGRHGDRDGHHDRDRRRSDRDRWDGDRDRDRAGRDEDRERDRYRRGDDDDDRRRFGRDDDRNRDRDGRSDRAERNNRDDDESSRTRRNRGDNDRSDRAERNRGRDGDASDNRRRRNAGDENRSDRQSLRLEGATNLLGGS